MRYRLFAQTSCRFCAQDIENHGSGKWLDRGGNRQCCAYVRRGEVFRPLTKHAPGSPVPTWQQVNPRAYPGPAVLNIDFGHPDGPRFCIVGTDYGYLHNTGGDIRTWRSYSGANRVRRAYVASHKGA